ncbi:MAG: PQQ-binding-like beta-propeller repeat protein [Planctomycetota bacterium]|nr:PQQ-binding-like beta-propeller repeat protein [Planctomycetota bacterium]
MLQGDVKNLPLSALLQGLDTNRNSGILSIESGDLAIRLGIDPRGVELLADSDRGSCLLGEILTGLDILQQEELANILANQGKTAMGDALLRFRLLDTQMVIGPIRTLLLERILELFRWQEASYRFEVCPWQQDRLFTGEAVSPSLRFPIPSLLLEVARREDEESRFKQTNIHSHEIFLSTADVDSLARAIETTLPLEPLRNKFVRALQQSCPLHDVIRSTGTPRFLALNSARNLVERGLLEPMPTTEKKALADRLIQQRLPGRAVEVLRSTICFGDADQACLEILSPLLRQEKAPIEERQQVLALLAEARRDAGDLSGTRKALRQRADLMPRDIDALIDLILALPGGKGRRESERLLVRLHDAVEHPRDALRVAEVIESSYGGDPGLHKRWMKNCARLRIAGGDTEGASRLIHSLLLEGVRKNRDKKSLQDVLALLESIDPRAHRSWRHRLARNGSAARRSGGVLLAAAFALVAFLVAYQDAITPEQVRAEGPDQSRPRIASQISVSEPAPAPSAPPVAMERSISLALKLRNEGKLVEALDVIEELKIDRLPLTTQRSIEKTRNEMIQYIEEARLLFDHSLRLSEMGEHQRALEKHLEMVREFPHSPLLDDLKLEIPIDMVPAATRILADGEPMDIRHFNDRASTVLLPAANPVLMTAESPGHGSQLLWHTPGQHDSISFLLSRTPDHTVSGLNPIETILANDGEALVVVDRQSTLHGFSIDGLEESWQLSIAGSGDLLAGALTMDRCVLLATTTGHLIRVELESGAILSRSRIATNGGIVRDTPVAAGSIFAVITSSGMVHAFEPESLSPLWNREFDSLRKGALLTAAGGLVIASPGALTGVDASTGSVLWITPLPNKPTASIVMGDSIFIAAGSTIEKYSGDSGARIWSVPTRVDAEDTLLCTQDVLVRISREGSVERIDPETGTIIWSSTGPADPINSAVTEDRVAIVGVDQNLQIFDLGDGSALWAHRGLTPWTSTVFQGGKLVVSDQQGSLLIFDRKPRKGDLPPKAGPS